MRTIVDEALVAVIVEKGWQRGSSLENRVALLLDQCGGHPRIFRQQYRVGRYRLDFAVPEVKVDLEADGRYHFTPQEAARNVVRDSWLRTNGWIVVRIE